MKINLKIFFLLLFLSPCSGYTMSIQDFNVKLDTLDITDQCERNRLRAYFITHEQTDDMDEAIRSAETPEELVEILLSPFQDEQDFQVEQLFWFVAPLLLGFIY